MRTIVTTLVAAATFGIAPVAASAGDGTVFEFPRLAGITTPNAEVRGLVGGGLPWSVDRGEARLEADGTLKVEVEGLVFSDGPNAGSNTVPAFVATLSCLVPATDAEGRPVLAVQNVTTAPVPATVPGGDARIEQQVAVPDTCFAPVVLVGSTAGRWFAISGF